MLVGGASVNRHCNFVYKNTEQTKMEREGKRERERKTWTLVCIRV